MPPCGFFTPPHTPSPCTGRRSKMRPSRARRSRRGCGRRGRQTGCRQDGGAPTSSDAHSLACPEPLLVGLDDRVLILGDGAQRKLDGDAF